MKDGGPAFPYLEPYWQGRRNEPIEHAGMSLRDYFAAAAMSGMIAHGDCESITSGAKTAYKFADAMLEAREK